MCSCVTLQIESVVESLAAERAQISLYIRMTFHVSIQESLQREMLGTDATPILSAALFAILNDCWGLLRVFLHCGMFVVSNSPRAVLNSEWILDAMSAIHKFQLNFCWQSQLQ